MKTGQSLALLVCLTAASTSPLAAQLVLHGTTEGASILTRPDTSGNQNYPVSADYRAASSAYAVNPFYTDTDGHFHIASYASALVGYQGSWNNFLILYQGSFDPAKPLQNAVFFNDDIHVNGIRAAGNPSTFSTTAFVQYFAVTTGVSLSESGVYTLVLGGRGNTFAGLLPQTSTAVPEPAAWAMFVSGFGIIGRKLRRKQRNSIPASDLISKHKQAISVVPIGLQE
jgi:hypothetical protein